MQNIFKSILCLVLLATLVSASSISIDSADKFPAGTTWTAIIEYDLSESSEAKLFLDNELLITVFAYNKKAFVDETQNSSKILNFNYTDNELTVSIAGLKNGEFELEANLYSNGEKIDSDSKEILFYDLETAVNSMQNTIDSQNLIIKSLQKDLNAKALEIEKLKINNQLTTESIKQITTNITILQANDSDKNTSLAQINSDLNKLLKDKELETGITGFFGVATSPLSIIALIGLITLIIIGAILYTNKKKKESLV